MKEFSFIATIFLVTERIGQKNIWDSGTVPLLNESQIEEMGFNGIYFGSHTATHIDMTQKSPDEIKKELEGSKKELERLTSRMDAPFCYPYARTNEQAQKLVRSAGFLCGVSGDMGSNGQSQNCFDLMRIQVFPSNELFAFWKKLQPWYPRWMEIQKRIKD